MNSIDPHVPGVKLDETKPNMALLQDFGLALLAVGEVATYGAKKYSVGGWQFVEGGVRRYASAKWRHMLKSRYEDYDPESGLLHKAHEAWNVLAELELMLRGGQYDVKRKSCSFNCDCCCKG